MRVVILASGQSNRMKPLTAKTVLQFFGKTLIQTQSEQLQKYGMTELIILYSAHNKEALAKVATTIEKNQSLSPKLIEQKPEFPGIAGAIHSLAQEYPDNRPFLLVSSNDIIADSGLQLILNHVQTLSDQSAIMAQEVTEYFPGGYIQLDQNGYVKTIIEKPGAGNEPSNLVNLIYHYHAKPQELFSRIATEFNEGRAQNNDQYEPVLQQLFEAGMPYKALAYNGPWHALKFPWHIMPMAAHLFASTMTPMIDPSAKIADSAVIKGPVYIGPNVQVFENAIIKGPAYIGANTIIADNCLIRESYIANDCIIGFATEIARSFLQERVYTHQNYVGDSVIGKNVSFGAGSVTANLRLDEDNIKLIIKNEKQDCGSNKLGIVTGNNIRIGINTSFMPGIKIGRNTMIAAGIVVNQDVPDNSFVKNKAELDIRPNQKEIGLR